MNNHSDYFQSADFSFGILNKIFLQVQQATYIFITVTAPRMKGISCVIIFTSCISVAKTQDINLDGAVSDKVELTLEERS